MTKDDTTLNERIAAVYRHYADMGYDVSKAAKAGPNDIAYYYACETFCQGWSLENGEKALYEEVVRCGIVTVCLQHRLILDTDRHKEEDYIKACRDAVMKVVSMYGRI